MTRTAALLLAAAAVAAGCITVNINFPTAEVEEAADRIIEDVRSAGTEGESASDRPEPVDASEEAVAPQRTSAALLASFPAPTAFAIAQGLPTIQDPPKKRIEIDIDDPAIRRIKAKLKERFKKLEPLFKRGAVGERRDGLVAALVDKADPALSLKEKKALEALVAGENEDRASLYKRIVEANDEIDDSRLPDVQRIFGERWIAAAKPGWWVQDAKGGWERKKKPKRAL